MKHFGTSHHFKRERRSVRCDYRGIVFARCARRILLPVRSSIPHSILRIFRRLSARLRSQHGTSSGAERSYASSDSCLREEITTRYHNLFWIWLNVFAFDSDALAAAPLPLHRLAWSP